MIYSENTTLRTKTKHLPGHRRSPLAAQNTLQNVQRTSEVDVVDASPAADEIDGDSRVVEMLDDGSMDQSLREDSQKGMWEARQEGMLQTSSSSSEDRDATAQQSFSSSIRESGGTDAPSSTFSSEGAGSSGGNVTFSRWSYVSM